MTAQPNSPEGQIIFDVTRTVVTKLAPEELIYLPELVESGLNPTDEEPTRAEDETLAFGIPGEIITIAPIVASMAAAAVTFLSTEVVKAVKESAGTAIEERLKAFFLAL